MANKGSEQCFEGEVLEALPSTTFRVRRDSGREVLAYLAGKMRMHFIKVTVGDRVTVQFSSYNPDHGRIIYRK